MNVVTLRVAGKNWDVPVNPDTLMPQPPRPADSPPPPREQVRAAMEAPVGFGPVRTALTPDDKVAIVLDESLPHAADLLAGVLDHLKTANIGPAAVTVVTAPPGGNQGWIDDLPDEYADVTAEVHDPADRKKFAYLAAAESGQPIYLNRTVVEADAVIVLAAVRYAGGRRRTAADVLYPALAGTNPEPVKGADDEPTAANDVLWQLGSTILVQVIPGADGPHAVVAGLSPSADDANKLLVARWAVPVPEIPDAVIAVADTDDFAAATRAVRIASKIVADGGRVALLTPATTNDFAPYRKAWARAAEKCRLFVGGGAITEIADDLGADTVSTPAEVGRIATAAERVLILRDALNERPRPTS